VQKGIDKILDSYSIFFSRFYQSWLGQGPYAKTFRDLGGRAKIYLGDFRTHGIEKPLTYVLSDDGAFSENACPCIIQKSS
jgi:hypothetical protein